MSKYYDENGNEISLAPSGKQYYDEQGNPLSLPAPAPKVRQTKTAGIQKPTPESEKQWADLINPQGRGFLENIAPMVAGEAANLIPGVGKYIAPLAAGGAQYAMHPEDPGAALAVGGLQGLPGLATGLKKGIMKLFPTNQIPEDLAALAAHPEMQPTVAQATKNKLANFLEMLGGHSKDARVMEQQQKIVPQAIEDVRQKVTGAATPAGAFTPLERQAPLRNVENIAHDTFRAKAEANTQTFPVKIGVQPSPVINPATGQPASMIPIYKNVDVAGPINIQKSTDFIQKIKPDIDQLYEQLPGPEKGVIGRLKQTLDKLASPEVITGTGDRIVPYDTVKQLRTDIGELAADKSMRDVYQSRQTGGLAHLRDLLGEDIDNSIARSWTIDKQGAQSALASANVATKQRIKAQSIDEMVKESTDQASKKFDADAFINKMKDTSDWHYKALTQNERGDIEQVMRAIRAVSPVSAGNYLPRSLAIHAGMFALGAAHGAIQGNLGTAGVEGLSLMIGSHVFANKVLLNPKYARLAARLPSLPTDSFEASTITKTLLKAMQGATIYITDKNGKQTPAIIDEKGKVEATAP